MIYSKNKTISNPASKVLIWLLLLLPLSCIDRLDYLGDTREGQLVIYGLFTDLEETHVVNVSRTVSFGLRPKGLADAQVTLLTSEGKRLIYSNVGNGDYELRNIKAEENKSYALEVLAEGEVYRSAFERIPNYVAEDSLSFSFTYEPLKGEISEQVFTLSAFTTVPSTPDPIFLRWVTEETHLWKKTLFPCFGLCPPPPPPCFIYDFLEPDVLRLFDGSTSNSRQINLVMGRRIVDNSFFNPFFFSVRQLSINRSAFEYWQKINIMINNRGSLFDIPPAPISGNISNVEDQNEIVLGYFEVAKTNITRIYTTRADVPFNMVEPCLFSTEKPLDSYPDECKDCGARAGNRKWNDTPPIWWKFD